MSIPTDKYCASHKYHYLDMLDALKPDLIIKCLPNPMDNIAIFILQENYITFKMAW